MAAPLADLVPNVSSTAELFQRINFLTNKMAEMEGRAGGQGKQREFVESKALFEVPKFGGDPKDWKDWEFKFHNFVRPNKYFEPWLNWIKDCETAPTTADRDTLQQRADSQGMGSTTSTTTSSCTRSSAPSAWAARWARCS